MKTDASCSSFIIMIINPYTSKKSADREPLFWNFLYHSRIVLSVGDSVWSLVRNLSYTVRIDSVLANSKTQNALVSPFLAMFRHDCPLAVKPASTTLHLLPKLGEILYLLMLLILSFLLCLSWLLQCRVRKFRRDLKNYSVYGVSILIIVVI
jgi:hypothetical protein